jgi:DNA-binding GntR family transcriptional regulator
VPTKIIDRVDPDDLYPGGLTKLYRAKYHIVRATVDAHYHATMATKDEARDLRIESGAPLIEEHRVSYCLRKGIDNSVSKGTAPYEYLVSLYSDRVSLDFGWADEGSVITAKGEGKPSP